MSKPRREPGAQQRTPDQGFPESERRESNLPSQLGKCSQGVHPDPPESISPGQRWDETASDACGYPGPWRDRGEDRPTASAEDPISTVAENAVEAVMAENPVDEAENAAQTADAFQQSAAALVQPAPTQEAVACDDWWNWI
jgi:hypothetical protein